VWVLVFGGIALVGLAVLVSYGVWIAHKVSDVWSEVRVLVDRGQQAAALLAEIEPPDVGEGGERRSTDRDGVPAT